MLDLSYIVQDMTNTNTDNKTEERKNRFNGESVMLTKEVIEGHYGNYTNTEIKKVDNA